MHEAQHGGAWFDWGYSYLPFARRPCVKEGGALGKNWLRFSCSIALSEPAPLILQITPESELSREQYLSSNARKFRNYFIPGRDCAVGGGGRNAMTLPSSLRAIAFSARQSKPRKQAVTILMIRPTEQRKSGAAIMQFQHNPHCDNASLTTSRDPGEGQCE